jgi:plastocyanin
MRKLVVLALVAAGAVALIALSGAPAGAKPGATAAAFPTRTIEVGDDFFKPRTIRVHKGQRVKFVWVDNGNRHNVRATRNARFYSGVRGQVRGTAGPYRITADVGKSVKYICEFHPDVMRGTLRVIR